MDSSLANATCYMCPLCMSLNPPVRLLPSPLRCSVHAHHLEDSCPCASCSSLSYCLGSVHQDLARPARHITVRVYEDVQVNLVYLQGLRQCGCVAAQ